MKLTLNETTALYYSVYQPHLLKRNPVLKRALKSGAKKLNKHMFALKRDALYNDGVKSAKQGKKPNCPKNLGCLQQQIWYGGYCSIRTDVDNPYGVYTR